MIETITKGTNYNPRWLASIGGSHWGNGYSSIAFKNAMSELKMRARYQANANFLEQYEADGADAKRGDADALFGLAMDLTGAGNMGVPAGHYSPMPELVGTWLSGDNAMEMNLSAEAEAFRNGQLAALGDPDTRAQWVEENLSDGAAGLMVAALRFLSDKKHTAGVTAILDALKPSRAPRPAPKPKAKTAKTADIAIDSRPVNV